MKKILFVCTGNLNRSYAAQMIARQMFPENEYDSVGTGKTCGGKLASKKIRVALERMGITFDSDRRSKPLTANEIDWADDIVCMGRSNLNKINSLFGCQCRLFSTGIHDPNFDKDQQSYDSVVEEIITKMPLVIS